MSYYNLVASVKDIVELARMGAIFEVVHMPPAARNDLSPTWSPIDSITNLKLSELDELIKRQKLRYRSVIEVNVYLTPDGELTPEMSDGAPPAPFWKLVQTFEVTEPIA